MGSLRHGGALECRLEGPHDPLINPLINYADGAKPVCALDEGKAMVRYRHYKGGIYELVCEATLESDPSVTMIVYRAANGTIWTRPASIFFELVEFEGALVPRFAPVN